MSKIDLTSFPKDRIKVLFLENISDKAVQYFKQQGYADVKKLSGALSEDELIKVIKDVHILLSHNFNAHLDMANGQETISSSADTN